MDNLFIENEVNAVFEEICELRRSLHKVPEIGNKEIKTTKIIEAFLEKHGIPFEHYLETGVVAFVHGKGEGSVVAIRADIDALPIEEKTDLPFASEHSSMMHACGHDVHTACALGAVKVIFENKDKLSGEVRFLFEPDEEGLGGAERLIKKGAMNGVDFVYGLHVRPDLNEDCVEVKYGKSYAASDVFTIEVIGKSSHGAEPHKGVDPILISSEIVLSLQSITSRYLDPTDSAVISVCQIDGGTVCNAIAPSVKMVGITRTLGKETREFIKKKLIETAKGIAELKGGECKVSIRESYPGIVNDNNETEFIKKVAEDVLGSDKVQVALSPLMTSEDFGYFLDEAPGTFFHLGSGCSYPLHSDKFFPRDEALRTGMKVYLKAVFEKLS